MKTDNMDILKTLTEGEEAVINGETWTLFHNEYGNREYKVSPYAPKCYDKECYWVTNPKI
jgi:hypothetical protein